MNSKEEIKIASSIILFGNSEYRITKPVKLSSQFVTVPFEDQSNLLMLSLSFNNITKVELMDMDQNSGVAFIFHLNAFMMDKVRGSLNRLGVKPKQTVPESRQIAPRVCIISSLSREERVLMLDFPNCHPDQMPHLRAILLESQKMNQQNQSILLSQPGNKPNLALASTAYIVQLNITKWVLALERFGKKWMMEDRIVTTKEGIRVIYRMGRTGDEPNNPGTQNQRTQGITLPINPTTSSIVSATANCHVITNDVYEGDHAYGGKKSAVVGLSNSQPIKSEPSIAESEEDGRMGNDEDGGEERRKGRKRKSTRKGGEEEEDNGEEWTPPQLKPMNRSGRRAGCFKLVQLKSELVRMSSEFKLKLVERNKSAAVKTVVSNLGNQKL